MSRIILISSLASILLAAVVVVTVRAQEQRGQGQQGQQMQKTVSIDDWPEVAKNAYKEMQAKYGPPNEVTPTRLIWTDKAPFREIILTKEAHRHDFPKPHEDCVEHVVAFKVPAEKASDLVESDGSLRFNRTAGTLSARCDSEAHNVGSLNLAHEIISGKKNVEQTRQAHVEAIKQELAGQMPQSMKALVFQPQPNAGDSDMAAVGSEAGEAQPAAAREPQSRQPQAQPQGQQD